MSHDLNQCSFIGRLGNDPEARQAGETNVSNFNIAVGSKVGDKESTEWVRIVAFARLADVCNEYLQRGQQVFVTGRLQSRKWVDKDGVERVSVEVIANNMQMLGKGKTSEERQQMPKQAQRQSASLTDIESDIPY